MTQPPMNPTAAGTGPIELRAHGFRLGVLPRLGASLTHLVWTPPGAAQGAEIDLMRRATPGDIASGTPSRLASFAMVPFTNRIDGGRLSFEDERGARQTVHVPINRAAQNAAIHGFGRTAPWQVLDHAPDRLRVGQTFRDPSNPYAYDAEQAFVLADGHVDCTLTVTNRGARALPFGIGFHPWFDRTPRATLAFAATHAFRMDDRDMPLEAVPAGTVTGASDSATEHRFTVAERTPFDTPVAGWRGTATLTWPERGAALVMTARGALGLVHIFSPPSPDVFCVEPVSHLPDVVNRRHLAAHGDMTLLAPGQTISGGMRLTPRALI